MALLISTDPYAQQQVLQGIVQVLSQHSTHSKKYFRDRIEYLSSIPNVDIVITGCFPRASYSEFGLAWFRKTNGSDAHLHPLKKSLDPFMVGGLVFHEYDQTWGVHT